MTQAHIVSVLVLAHVDENEVGWRLDAWVFGPLLAVAAFFVIGYVRVAKRASRYPASSERVILFVLGWCVLSVALLSPLHEAGERSFAAHMFEHELLMLVAAPLLVVARVQGMFLWAFPHTARLALARFFQTSPVSETWGRLTNPLIATVLQAAALWLWHAPPLFDLALRSDGWHIAQHLSFLLTALLFWSAMFSLRRRRTHPMIIVVCLFVTALVSGALGALMAFSQSPWYAGYRALELSAFGLTPTQDQQIAGLLMWIPGGLVHLGVALTVLAGVLRPTEQDRRHSASIVSGAGGIPVATSTTHNKERHMGNQSQQSDADNRQQGFGGGQPEMGDDEKELRQPRRPQPHQSGDRNANEALNDESRFPPQKRP